MGVYFEPSSGKYRARLQVNGERIHLGRFADRQMAELAYTSAKKFYKELKIREIFNG